MPETRPVRDCDICGATDDHPRHDHSLDDGSTQLRHLDCCASAGCPDGSCDQTVADSGGLTGEKLIAYLTKGS